MIILEQTLQLVYYSELILFILTSFLLIKEFLVLKQVISHSTTLSLLGFLLSIWLMTASRFLGISLNSILIRTYLTAIFGLIGTLLFINWATDVSKISSKQKMVLILSLIFGMVSFLFTRTLDDPIYEMMSILLLIGVLLIAMVKVMKFVFATSPYIRSRHRLFLLTLSFVMFAIFEGIAVFHMGQGNYSTSMLFFLLQIPARIGITLSIVLPLPLTELLRKFIH